MMDSIRHLTPWRVIVIAILGAGVWATVVRFGLGLEASTHMQDAVPWGLWVGFDVLVGVGLAAGGFSVAAAVHVFGLDEYRPIARPAVMTALLGYLLVIVGLLFDLGKPWNGWHPLVMWNPRSVMFEVTWCVILYTTVLALELSPLVFERLGLEAPRRLVRRAYVPIVIAGVLLSMMHQSSLGSLFLIVPDKLHGLWYTPWLPVFFFVTAIAAGLGMTIVESFLSRRAFGRALELPLLEGLGRGIAVVLAIYLVAKTGDLAYRGQLPLVFALGEEAVMFWGEMGLGVLLPVALLRHPAAKKSEGGLFLAATLTVLGFVLGRLNVGITGMRAASGVDYFPSWMEIAVSASLVALGFAAFGWAVRHLFLFGRAPAPAPGPTPAPLLGGRSLAGLWGLTGVGLLLALLARDAEAEARPAAPEPVYQVRAPDDLTLPEAWEIPMGEQSIGQVVFEHRTHVELSPPNCQSCHDGTWSLVERGKLLVDLELVHEVMDEGQLCGRCHDGEQAFDIGECESCHAEE